MKALGTPPEDDAGAGEGAPGTATDPTKNDHGTGLGSRIDAFMAAAKGGDLDRLLQLLAPDAVVDADAAAIAVGTPPRIDGRDEVAAFFDGSAHAALAVFVGDRPGTAWFDRGQARVVFDFVVADGLVRAITFRAAPETLAQVVRRSGGEAR